jgi:NAD-dependent dihydropyrimidine dehydrogenase PreA subunit
MKAIHISENGMEKKIVFCHCQGNIVDSSKLEDLEQWLEQMGIPYTGITDLCGVCAAQPNELQKIFSAHNEIFVVACYPRVLKMLLRYNHMEWESDRFFAMNLRESALDDLKKEIQRFVSGDSEMADASKIACSNEWPAWYPVIDYSRCSSCGQCAEFCLFGVYEKKDGLVKVIHPQGCKNNCPACARICPQTAIIFPKYELPGAIAGSETINEVAEHQRQIQDMDAILGSDIYKALENRKLKRQSIVRNDVMNQALEEREKALKEMTKNK